MRRGGGRRLRGSGVAARPRARPATQPDRSAQKTAWGREAAPADDGREPLARARLIMLAVAAALAAGGSVWISLQPTVTHSDLDDPVIGSVLRWFLYFLPTLIGTRLWASRLDGARPPGPGPVVTALTLAAPAVAAGTLTEILARLILGHGDVLALDGVFQRVIELVRVDVPISVVVAIVLTHRQPALVPAGAFAPAGRRPE
jgi:hypothetical protein